MKQLKTIIQKIKTEVSDKIIKASTNQELEAVRVEFLGRNGKVASLMKELKTLPLEGKKECGPLLNNLKKESEELYNKKIEDFAGKKSDKDDARKKYFDVSAYKPNQLRGTLHPYSSITQQLEDIFISMGYEVADGPEVETDYYNFQALNIPADHPSRDMQDTLWLTSQDKLLRTQTSPVQIRYMETHKPPIAMIAPGRTYRHEATDASHDIMFSQVEGLFIDKNVSMSHLIATIKKLILALFDLKNVELRIRPGYFPFVEPAIEVDFACPFCKSGCSTCKGSRWIELVPGGLVHPNVLKSGGIDPNVYSGFAFGLGLTRLVMLLHSISDIRLLHNNSIEFLQQF